MLANWERKYTIERVLTQLREEMAAPDNSELVQADGSYPFLNRVSKMSLEDGNLDSISHITHK